MPLKAVWMLIARVTRAGMVSRGHQELRTRPQFCWSWIRMLFIPWSGPLVTLSPGTQG